MPNSKQIVYLSQAQYAELIANGTITVDGVTVTYDENDIYVTPQAEPVTDVRVAGTSVAANGVANVPVATSLQAGVVRGVDTFGVSIGDGGIMIVNPPSNDEIKTGSNNFKPIVPSKQSLSTFYGLAKASGDTTQSQSSNSVGTYTPEAKGAIQSMLGVSDLIATAENNLVASKAYAIGDVFTANGKLYKATAAIAADEAIITDGASANCEETSVGEGFPHDVQVNGVSVVSNGIANIPMANDSTVGVIKTSQTYGTGINDGKLQIQAAPPSHYKSGEGNWRPITPAYQHQATFYGLAKAAGADEKDSTLPVGEYTDTAKSAIRTMIGAIGDVQVNSTSIITNGVANIPVASESSLGLIQMGATYSGLVLTNNKIRINPASSTTIKQAEANFMPIVTSTQHEATFYGLAKAAGDTTQSQSDNAVGIYTADASAAIRSMIGAVGTSDYANATVAGVVKVNSDYNTGGGIGINSNGMLSLETTTDAAHKNGTATNRAVLINKQHSAVFYGLAKAAGDTTQSQSSNTVGTYTDEAKTAIRTMLGAVGTEDYATEDNYGLVKVNSNYGVAQNIGSGALQITGATAAQCKSRIGSTGYQPLTVFVEDASAFYGLAYAAGDTTMASSSNAVGQYTDNAKASIKAMLGIQDGSTGTVDVSGTTPTITAVENTRYVCGEVTSLSFTPPASGISIVRFTSGSSVTVLTIPSTVKFPEWFDPTSLETNTIYELCVTDGVYGAVMSWAL